MNLPRIDVFTVPMTDWQAASLPDLEGGDPEAMLIQAQEPSGTSGEATTRPMPPEALYGALVSPRPRFCDQLFVESLTGIDPELWHRLINALPVVEADVLELGLLGKSEYEIADVLGVTQMAVSYRWYRLVERLRWHIGPGRLFDEDDMQCDKSHFVSVMYEKQFAYLMALWRTGSYTAAGRACLPEIGASSMQVRCRSALRRLLRSRSPELAIYRQGFGALYSWGMGLLTEVVTARSLAARRLRGET